MGDAVAADRAAIKLLPRIKNQACIAGKSLQICERRGLEPIPKSLATLVNVIEQSLRRSVSLRPFRVWLDFTGVPNLPGGLNLKIRK
jgi:hypothetical protein